ncbi:hypothetical protein CJ483_13545 [Bacillus sp. PK3_68]|nr:hypothetical protein CJ483_13545 [Bacillus sp. PK3_68]
MPSFDLIFLFKKTLGTLNQENRLVHKSTSTFRTAVDKFRQFFSYTQMLLTSFTQMRPLWKSFFAQDVVVVDKFYRALHESSFSAIITLFSL